MLKEIDLRPAKAANLAEPYREAELGAGRLLASESVPAMLPPSLPREGMAKHGIRFVLRTHPKGLHYFLVKGGEKAVDAWVTLGRQAQSAVVMDALSGASGKAALDRTSRGECRV